MTCWTARRKSTEFLDGRLRGAERTRVQNHIQHCVQCASLFEQFASLRSGLNELRAPVAPARLVTDLRVIASKERQALLRTQGSRLARLWDYWSFRLDELMRPLTIPAAGGILSSFLLFAVLALAIGTTTRVAGYEVPLFYGEHLDPVLVPLQLRSSVMLRLSVDPNGRIIEYVVSSSGQSSFAGDPDRLQYNNIRMPKFPSVLALAQPISSDISIEFKPMVFRQ